MSNDRLLPDMKHRFEVYIPAEQAEWIKRTARQGRKPAAQLIRELIEAGRRSYASKRTREEARRR